MKPAPACLALAASLFWASPAAADCMCVANGTRFEQGQTTCIRLSSGSFVARCEKILNNSSWKKIAEGCPDESSVTEKQKRG